MDSEQLELFGKKELNSISKSMAEDLIQKVENLEIDNAIYERALKVCRTSFETLLSVFPKGTANYVATESMINYVNEVLEE